MADLTNGSTKYQTYDNSGNGVAELGDNYAAKTGQGIAGRTQIVTLVREDSGAITQANLDAFIRAVTIQGGAAGTSGLPCFTVVGVSAFTAGSSTSVLIALQGTATFTTDTDDAYGVTGLSATLTGTFAGLQA